MKYQVAEPDVAGPFLAIGVPKHTDKKLPPERERWDAPSGGALKRLFENGDFTGAKDESWTGYLSGGTVNRLLLVGMGKVDDVGRTQVRRAAAIAARRGRAWGT